MLAQPAAMDLSPDELSLLASGGGRVVVRGDGQRWLAATAAVGTLGWMVVVAQREEQAKDPKKTQAGVGATRWAAARGR